MVTCPRCEQPVDETVRTTCPLCFTPIQPPSAAPQTPSMPSTGAGINPLLQGTTPQISQVPQVPQGLGGLGDTPQHPSGLPGIYPQQAPPVSNSPASPSLMNPGARVSLTGEVIDSGMSSGPPPNYVGGSAIPQPPRPGGVTAPRPATTAGRRPVAEAPAKSGGGVAAIVVVLVLLLGGGFGGWYYMMHRTNPKDQALSVYKAFLGQDWNTLYSLTALSEENKKRIPNAEAYAKDAQAGLDQANSLAPIVKTMMDAFKSNANNATVGEPIINGDKADVPTSVTVSALGRSLTFKGTAHMINDRGIWKFDLTSNNQSDSFKAGQDMVGKPEGLGGGGMSLPGQ